MKETFESFMNRLSPTIRRISHRLNGHFTFFNDDDLCQEAYVHLWLLFQNGKLDDKTDSYILQGCYYHLKNHIRTSSDKMNAVSLESPVDEDGTQLKDLLASQDATMVNDMEEKILLDFIEKGELNDREKKVLDLSLASLTTREIGAKLNISHVAVVKIRKRIKYKCGILEKELRAGYQN
ncbi:MAG: sigma-70 family RNA polymerase sigma factor [Candidatus Omnitrophota bacterium]|nr:sigma-70 family RNA polymerase sigma factor [Candidatus Omnitrophota bacterium]